MKNFLHRHWLLGSAIGLNLIAVGVLVWLLANQTSLVEELATLATTHATLEQQGQQLQALRQLIDSTAVARQQLDQRFLTQDALPTFIEQLEQVGQDSQVQLQLVGVEVGSGPGATVRFGLNLSGTLTNLARCYQLLTHLPYRLVIRQANLNWQGTSERQASNNWNSQLNVEVLSYWNN